MNDKIALGAAGHGAPAKNQATTWLNHYSIQQCMQARIDISGFTKVGIDGIFLNRLLPKNIRPERSSADTVMPNILRGEELSVGLIGGDSHGAERHRAILVKKFPRVKVLWSVDGYQVSNSDAYVNLFRNFPVDIVLIGAGAPKQEMVALELFEISKTLQCRTSIFTCGGWLDQLENPGYYPRWAYPLRLNWAVRLWREPRRLWKRYTFDAVTAIFHRREILNWLEPASLSSFDSRIDAKKI